MTVVKQYNPIPSFKQLNGQAQKKIQMGGVKRPTTESNCCCVHQRKGKQLTKKLFAASMSTTDQIAHAEVAKVQSPEMN